MGHDEDEDDDVLSEHPPMPHVKIPPLRAWVVKRAHKPDTTVIGHVVAFPFAEIVVFMEFMLDPATGRPITMNRRSFHGWEDIEEVGIPMGSGARTVQ